MKAHTVTQPVLLHFEQVLALTIIYSHCPVLLYVLSMELCLQGVGRKQNLPPRLQRQQEQQKQQQQQRPLSPQPGGPLPSQQQAGPGAGIRQGPYPWPPYGGPQSWAGMPPMPMPWDMRMSGGRPPIDIPPGSGALKLLICCYCQ